MSRSELSGMAVVVVVVEEEALVAVVAVDDDDAVVGVVEAGVVAWVPDTRVLMSWMTVSMAAVSASSSDSVTGSVSRLLHSSGFLLTNLSCLQRSLTHSCRSPLLLVTADIPVHNLG